MFGRADSQASLFIPIPRDSSCGPLGSPTLQPVVPAERRAQHYRPRAADSTGSQASHLTPRAEVVHSIVYARLSPRRSTTKTPRSGGGAQNTHPACGLALLAI